MRKIALQEIEMRPQKSRDGVPRPGWSANDSDLARHNWNNSILTAGRTDSPSAK
jgi:hypothetical protein